MLPVLVCPVCEHQIMLPYRRFVGSQAIEPYWPSPDGGLEWVCDQCSRHESSSIRDVLWLADDLVAPTPSHRGFWRVEIPCSAHHCHSSAVVHIQTFGQTSRRNLGLMVANGLPSPVCALGHPVEQNHSYPDQVDFVEWNGTDGYLT